MKAFNDYLFEKEKAEQHPVVLAFGRFQPPTAGHGKVIDKVHELAEEHQAPHHVVLSQTFDGKKNPLDPEIKLKHARAFWPKTNFSLATREHPSIIQQAQKLNENKTHLHIVAGDDRVKEYRELLNKYNGDLYHYKKIRVHSAGERKEQSDGTIGISGTKMRQYAVNGDFNKFMAGAPKGSDKAKKDLYNDLRTSMMKEETKKAIFVVGGPCSGKDLIIRHLKENYILQEFEVGNLYKKPKPFDLRSERIIVNGPAYDFATTRSVKELLEDNDYQCMMIFVDVTNGESKLRNEARIIKGSRLLAEEKRYEKWFQSQNNLVPFYELFETFIHVNNDKIRPFDELFEKVDKFITEVDINEEIGNLFAKEEKIIVLKKKKGNTPVKQGPDIDKTITTKFGGGIWSVLGANNDINEKEKISFMKFRKKIDENI